MYFDNYQNLIGYFKEVMEKFYGYFLIDLILIMFELLCMCIDVFIDMFIKEYKLEKKRNL